MINYLTDMKMMIDEYAHIYIDAYLIIKIYACIYIYISLQVFFRVNTSFYVLIYSD